MVAKLQKVPDIVSFLPLFLQADVLALYLKMSDEDMIETRLKKAFTEGSFEAYEKLKRVKWTSTPIILKVCRARIKTEAIIVHHIINGINIVIGIDVINKMVR